MTEIRIHRVDSIKCCPIESKLGTRENHYWMEMIVTYDEGKKFSITFFTNELKNILFEDNIPPDREVIEQFEKISESEDEGHNNMGSES